MDTTGITLKDIEQYCELDYPEYIEWMKRDREDQDAKETKSCLYLMQLIQEKCAALKEAERLQGVLDKYATENRKAFLEVVKG
jgi:hypothetical protein